MPHAENGRVHVVQAGDSTTSLAFASGLFWESVWNHSKNQGLREKREKPNVLAAGDEIFIPDIETGKVGCATEKKHTFRRKGVPEKLNVRFTDHRGKPYADKEYALEIDGTRTTGTLDSDGWLRVSIPPDARSALLTVGKHGDLVRRTLNLGKLDPIDLLSGAQARLKNLGYYRGDLDGEESEALRRAVARFRQKNGLEAGDQVDDAFRDKLKEVHKV